MHDSQQSPEQSMQVLEPEDPFEVVDVEVRD